MPPMRRRGRPGLIGMAARTAVIAGTATATSNAVNRHGQQKAAEQEAEAAQLTAAQGPPQGYAAPPPGYDQAPQGYDQAPQGYDQPAEGYGQPPQGYGQAVGYAVAPGYPPAPGYSPAPEAVGPADSDLMTQLTQLAQLHQAGVLTDEEFTAAKAKILAG
jgi:hypothetical protein